MTSPFGFVPMPEELRQQIEHQIQTQEMTAESFRHDVQRLFDELSLEHLTTLRIVLRHLVMSDNTLTAYYEGVAATTLHLRFSVCGGCGQNHDQEALAGLEEEISAKAEPVTAAPTGQQELPFGPSDPAKLLEYGVDDAYDQDNGRYLGVICLGCGMRYPSLEDRMLKGPDECSGCIQKAKWG